MKKTSTTAPAVGNAVELSVYVYTQPYHEVRLLGEFLDIGIISAVWVPTRTSLHINGQTLRHPSYMTTPTIVHRVRHFIGIALTHLRIRALNANMCTSTINMITCICHPPELVAVRSYGPRLLQIFAVCGLGMATQPIHAAIQPELAHAQFSYQASHFG